MASSDQSITDSFSVIASELGKPIGSALAPGIRIFRLFAALIFGPTTEFDPNTIDPQSHYEYSDKKPADPKKKDEFKQFAAPKSTAEMGRRAAPKGINTPPPGAAAPKMSAPPPAARPAPPPPPAPKPVASAPSPGRR